MGRVVHGYGDGKQRRTGENGKSAGAGRRCEGALRLVVQRKLAETCSLMKTLPRCVMVMVVAGLMTACESRPVNVGTKGIAQGVENPKRALPPGPSENRVTVSARYVRIEQAMPEAKTALAFFADEAGLKAGTVVLTRSEADAALGELTLITGRDAHASERVTVEPGLLARLQFTQFFSSRENNQSQVRISVGGVEQEFQPRHVGLGLIVTPRVVTEGRLQMEVEIQQTTFEGFIEYGGEAVNLTGSAVETASTQQAVVVPRGFYQPIFAHELVMLDVAMDSGKVVVIRMDPKKPATGDQRFGFVEKMHKETEGTLLVFLTAEQVRAGR